MGLDLQCDIGLVKIVLFVCPTASANDVSEGTQSSKRYTNLSSIILAISVDINPCFFLKTMRPHVACFAKCDVCGLELVSLVYYVFVFITPRGICTYVCMYRYLYIHLYISYSHLRKQHTSHRKQKVGWFCTMTGKFLNLEKVDSHAKRMLMSH